MRYVQRSRFEESDHIVDVADEPDARGLYRFAKLLSVDGPEQRFAVAHVDRETRDAIVNGLLALRYRRVEGGSYAQ